LRIFARRALLPEGWRSNVTIDVDAAGTITRVADGQTSRDATEFANTLVPGMPNLHSHAFQRAMAGKAERRSRDRDDFWSWRETMYALAATLDPDELHRIALGTYRAMLRAGYTAVAEFHYLHRDPSGAWYADKCAMADALVSAARDVGLAICLLPALYTQANPAGAPLGERQKRFLAAPDDVLEIAAAFRARYAHDPGVVVGVCAHSLRAATLAQFRALLDGSPRDVPVHLHIAEQEREVAEIEAAYGARPIELLLRSFAVDERWCLVHATQATDDELRAIAETGAVVGLCPTTEANLGDGIFPFEPFARAGGHFGIGSDSNVSISPVEELRLLEYGQRLTQRRRIIAANDARSCGEALYAEAAASGARACGSRSGALAPGLRADFIELPDDGGEDADPLDCYIFAGLQPFPARVVTGGHWRRV
jgi:formimidoylglutamate deiminase